MSAQAHVYERADGRYAFRIIAGNGEIVATDGGQGYENRTDAERTARRLATGWEADMKQQTEIQYGVARKDTILHDRLYSSYIEAHARLVAAEIAMREAGLEPDVRLVEVEATTTYSRPRAAKTPEYGTPENGPAEPGTTGEGATFPASGVWGDDGSASPGIIVGPSEPTNTTPEEQANPAAIPEGQPAVNDSGNTEIVVDPNPENTDTETAKD